MNARNRLSLLMTLITIGGFTCASDAKADDSGDAARGRDIALTHCTRCHVVGNYNPNGGISSTPSFQILLKRRPDWLDRFETFHVRPPHPAFLAVAGLGRKREDLPANAHPINIELKHIEDIVAFVKTMKAGKKVGRTPPQVRK